MISTTIAVRTAGTSENLKITNLFCSNTLISSSRSNSDSPRTSGGPLGGGPLVDGSEWEEISEWFKTVSCGIT